MPEEAGEARLRSGLLICCNYVSAEDLLLRGRISGAGVVSPAQVTSTGGNESGGLHFLGCARPLLRYGSSLCQVRSF